MRIATKRSSSASNSRNAAASNAAVGRSTALRASGRLIVTTVTRPVVFDLNGTGIHQRSRVP